MGRRMRTVPPLGLMLEASGAEPLHRQIGAQLRQAILERRLAPGLLLPSSRVMAAELDCARGTVLAALDQLVAEGYLVSRSTAGIAVAADLPDEMLAPAVPGRAHGVVPRAVAREEPLAAPMAFPIGLPDREAFPFPLWAKLLEQEWRRPGWEIAGEPHPFGHRGLRAAIAGYLGAARGFSCSADAVVVTAGVRQSVELVARLVLEPGEAAWTEEPGYPGMIEALAGAGVRAVAVPVDGEGFSPAAALALVPAARLAIVAPAHHFPLGTVMSLKRRLALLSWAERAGHWIIEDDFDGEYRYSGRPLAPLRALDRAGRVAYLGSFSKLLFPALRLSFLVLPEALAGRAEALVAGMAMRASLLGQGALARFIDEGHLAGHLRRTRLLYAGRQQALIAAAGRHLAGLLDVKADPGGMHLVATPEREGAPGFDDGAAVLAAGAAGVRVAALTACYSGAERRHGLLLGYAGTPDREIEPAVERLRDVLTGLRSRVAQPGGGRATSR